MPEPTALLHALRASTADLLHGLDAAHWSDADLATPSLCPGWTRGHVLTHLARNADGIVATLTGALDGTVVARYPRGSAGRDADIAAGAGRPATELLADVRESAERLDRVVGAVQEADAWTRPSDEDKPAEYWLAARWQEVEIHRVDLAGDYVPRRWPPELVESLLPRAAAGLGDRTDAAVRVIVAADGSLVPSFAGRSWQAGSGTPVEISGPDWAVLAWLLGRGAAVADALQGAAELADWR